MDEDIAKWILDFLLRQQIDEKIVNGVLSSLPLADNDNRLKKTLLLRRIESEISNGSVSEKLLDFLEIIEELDHRDGKRAPESMKQAYCAVAVDCTVRFLEENVEKNGKYFDAVRRVWRERVCKVEGLASEESNRWLGEMEAAMWDSDACGRILMRNSRNEALKAVRVYLKEAWGSLGPSFLELVAEKFGKDVEGLCDGGGGSDRVQVPANRSHESVPVEGNHKVQGPLRRKHVAIKKKRRRGAKISVVDEGGEDELRNQSKCHKRPNISDVDEGNGDESMNKDSDGPTHGMERVQAELEPCSTEQNAAVRNNLPEVLQTAQTLSSTSKTEGNSSSVIGNQTSTVMKATPEVDKVQKALKSSSIELQAAVKDPLPDALQTAQILSSTMGTNKANSDTAVVNQTGSVTPELREPNENASEKAEKKDNPVQDAQGDEVQDRKKLRNLPRRSLMEPNGTGHTMEWDDSIENLPGGSPSRPRLPSPKETKCSPLNKYDSATKFNRRRVRKMWTPLEEDTLRAGVKKFGRGNWKLILHCYREIYGERTEVDLKDKWRNMTRSS